MCLHIRSLLYCLFLTFTGYTQPIKYTYSRPKMGSPFNITVYALDTVGLQNVIEKAYQKVDILNQIFSDYSPNSEISILTKNARKNQPIKVSNELMMILKKADTAFHISNGAYDITVGHIVQLWRKARKNKTFPNITALKSALSKTGFSHIHILSDSTIAFDTEGVLLDFGGIIKGYAAQEVVNILKKYNFPHCIADAGGDLAMGEKPMDTQGWIIGINAPQSEMELTQKRLLLNNKAVATSGDMYNFVEIDGKRYSHIVNPKTGIGLTHQRNVTVIANDGATADWLATACSVLPIKKAMRIIKKIPNAELLILEKQKKTIKIYESKGFSQYLISK
jgi:FAD:protein FMN transferase